MSACYKGFSRNISFRTPEPVTPSHKTIEIIVERSPTRTPPRELEAFGSTFNEYASYAPPLRNPYASRYAAAPYPIVFPIQADQFSSQMEYNLEFVPKDNNIEQTSNANNRYRWFERNATGPTYHLITSINTTSTESIKIEKKVKKYRGMMEDESGLMDEAAAFPAEQLPAEEKQESLMQWFDSSMDKEMKKHKELSIGSGKNVLSSPPPPKELNISKNVLDMLGEASASQVQFTCQMKMQPDTELTDAADKLATAEAMCAFAGAVKAAEAAAEAAPPGRAEEAALTSARDFQTEVTATSAIRETINGGTRPLEVLGYVGVTKPKYPTGSKE